MMLFPGILVATIECHLDHLRRQHASQTSEARGQAGHSEACCETCNSEARRERDFKEVVAGVSQRSDAMDLESGVFKKSSARQIALSLKRSVERSGRRKSPPFRSAMSMLNFEINRAGKNLSAQRRGGLNQSTVELR